MQHLRDLIRLARKSIRLYGTAIPPDGNWDDLARARVPQKKKDTKGISKMIDRLIIGRPPQSTLSRRARELIEADWTLLEIAAEFGVTRRVIQRALLRSHARPSTPSSTTNGVRSTVTRSRFR